MKQINENVGAISVERAEPRKVRKDFDVTKEYRVNVAGSTDEEKKAVQDAFIAIGYKWWHPEIVYHHLDALYYGNINRDGMTYLESWDKKPTEKSISTREFLSLVYEPVRKLD